jgi:hypothetical protein
MIRGIGFGAIIVWGMIRMMRMGSRLVLLVGERLRVVFEALFVGFGFLLVARYS